MNSLDTLIASLAVVGLLGAIVLVVFLRPRPSWQPIATYRSGPWQVPTVPLRKGARVRCMVPLPMVGVHREHEGTFELVLPVRDEYHYRVRFDGHTSTVTFLDNELWQLEILR